MNGVFRPLLCTVKAELGRGQPELMRDADPGVGTSEHIVGLRLRMVESFLINNLDLQAHH